MRFELLDIYRWIAIILMILFHINYSLLNIFNINLLNFSEYFWLIIWKIAVFLFIFIAWIWFFLAEKKYKNKVFLKYLKTSLKLFFIAFIISFVTYFILDWTQFIRFWIIHFFSLSFFLILFFRKFKFYNIFIWTFILIYWFYYIPVIKNEYLYFLWFMYPWFKSADYYPLIPYFGLMLYWYSFWLILDRFNKLDLLKSKSKDSSINLFLSYLWKKSIIIYLIHQPIILLVLYTFLR